MEYKKTIILLALVVFLLSIAGVSASEIGDTIASENANTIELSTDNDIEDNLQTSEENEALASPDYDEAIAQTDTEVLGADSAKYSDLAAEIGQPGNINLTHKNYTYDGGETITISEDNKVIDGNGAVIDMNGSTIRAFYISGSGVTIKNLTIKNANYNGNGGAIYFSISATSSTVSNCNFTDNTAYGNGGAVYFVDSGTVTNCNFVDNKATGEGSWGGAIYIYSGTVSICNFVDNTAYRGGAVYFYGEGNVSNCNFTDNSARGGGAVYFDDNGNGNVTNCNFTGNTATGDGGAISIDFGTVSNCNFADNTAVYGGAINIDFGTVSNCNFVNNSATGEGSWGGAIKMYSGTVSNCNFTGNTASGDGGAVYFNGKSDVTNCNFVDNKATGDLGCGGAVYLDSNGEVTNCNFTDNTATSYGGAVYFYITGTVSNCNFAGNNVTGDGGAIYFLNQGTVSICNFVDNTATSYGGAIYFVNQGTVTNCNFVDNTATYDGGAVYFNINGEVTNCNFINNTATENGGAVRMNSGNVSNCNFIGNNATEGSAIYFYSTSATKIVSNSRFLNNRANAEELQVTKNENNITIIFKGHNNLLNAIYSRNDAEVTFINVTYWGAKGINNTGSSEIKPSRSKNESGQNITVGIVVNGILVLNEVKVTDKNGMIVLPIKIESENYYIGARHDKDSYYTEAEKTISNNMKFSVNVTSQTANNRTVNITAKSDIYGNFMSGKLLFILPNGTQIEAAYGSNGTWWAEHTFDAYGEYKINATYVGLDNVTINNGTITINKVNSTITLDNIVLDYDETKNVTVTTTGATGITAKIDGNNVTVINNYTIQIPVLDAGTYTLTVTTITDDDHNPVTKEVNITVNKVNSTLTVGDMVFDYGSSGSIIVSVTGADGVNANVVGKPEAVVKVNGTNITVSDLDAGTYTLTVTAIADKNHNNITKNATITVNKVNATLTVDDVVLDYGETKNITVTAEGATGIVARIGESEAKVDGFVISIPALDAGTYTLTVTAIGDKNHNNITKNATITVNKLKTELTGNAITTTYNVNKDLVITLKDITGKALSGVKVTVDLNGAKTYTTDKNGQVKVSTKGLAPKAYTAKVTFNGDTNYGKSTKDIKVTVKKATPKLTAKKKTFKTTTKTKKYTIVLKDNTGKAIKKAKVALKVKGKTYKATTNSKGKATFKITKLNKKGTFKATITYKGNKYYNKVSKKAKIKVIVKFKTVSKGSKDKATVKEIQQALKDKGYYLTYQGHYLKVDGKFNSCTFRSIKEFQHDKGLKVTGKVDEKTAKKLGIL